MSSSSDDFRDFVYDMVVTQARVYGAIVPDSPQRIAPPDESDRVPFLDLPIRRQLEAAEYACRRPCYLDALREALPESDEYDRWLTLLRDPEVSPAEVGRMAREIALEYLDHCAERRGERLEDL